MVDPWLKYHDERCDVVWHGRPATECDCGLMALVAAVEAKHAQERDSLCAEITRLLKGDPETEILQAVLDAVKGTLDPHSQIADHPNVKFVQMELLKLRGRV